MMRLVGPLAFLGMAALACGCNRGPQIAETEGVVTKGGTPLKNVRVEFWPESDGPKSTAVTDEQGRYILKTEDGSTDGAVVGSHKVVLKDMDHFGEKFLGRKAESMPSLGSKGAKERFSKDYGDAAKTKLKKDVLAGQKNVLNLEIQ